MNIACYRLLYNHIIAHIIWHIIRHIIAASGLKFERIPLWQEPGDDLFGQVKTVV